MKNKFSSNVVFDSRDSKPENRPSVTTEHASSKSESKAVEAASDKISESSPDGESVSSKISRKKPGRKKIDPSEKKSQVAITIKRKTIDILSEAGDYRKKLNRYIDDNAEAIRDILKKY